MRKFFKRYKGNAVTRVVPIFIFVILFILLFRYFKMENVVISAHKNILNHSFYRTLELQSQNIYFPSEVLNNITPNTFHLLFVYSGGECDKCIFEDIQMIKNKFSANNIDKVVVLPIFPDSRKINISLRSDLDGIKYYRIDPHNVNLPQYNGFFVCFFCILSPTNEIILPFFPEIGDSKRTKEYLDFVETKYLNI